MIRTVCDECGSSIAEQLVSQNYKVRARDPKTFQFKEFRIVSQDGHFCKKCILALISSGEFSFEEEQ